MCVLGFLEAEVWYLHISATYSQNLFTPRREGLLSSGQWSNRGCFKNIRLSNDSVTVCECHHLTHFAMLLSASPPNISESLILSLQTIGYVGVTVSLVAMAFTITTFVLLK